MTYKRWIRIMLTRAEGFYFEVLNFSNAGRSLTPDNAKCNTHDEFCKFKGEISIIKDMENLSFLIPRVETLSKDIKIENLSAFERLTREKEKKDINEDHPFLYSAFLYLIEEGTGHYYYPKKTSPGVLLKEVQVTETGTGQIVKGRDTFRVELFAGNAELKNI